MKSISISKIEPTNPILASYVKRIKSWNGEEIVQKDQDNHIKPFYAIYLDSLFLAAGRIELDKENSSAKVAMVNGSVSYYDQIQEFATSSFKNILHDEYNCDDVEFSYIKKIG